MNAISNSQSTENTQETLLDMSFKELLARSPGGGADQFLMEIEVKSKTIVKMFDKLEQPYFEISVDYVTIPKGKRKTKKTRPTFEDGRLIWEQISGEPGVHYVVTLTRSNDPERPYYDWTKIDRLDDGKPQSVLIDALSEDAKNKLNAVNDPSFEQVDIEASSPTPANDAESLT